MYKLDILSVRSTDGMGKKRILNMTTAKKVKVQIAHNNFAFGRLWAMCRNLGAGNYCGK